MKIRALLKEKERTDEVQVILNDEERKIHLQALKEMERRGKFEDAQAFKRHLKIEEPDDDEIEQEEVNVQVQNEEQNENENEDIFCSPENKDWMTASQALPEAKKRQIEARVAAWRKRIRDEVIAEMMAKQNGKDGEVVEARAGGQAVGEAKAVKDDDSLKTPLKPKTQKTLKIVEDENSDEDITPKMINEEEEARRQYEESVAKMKQANERIKRIKAEKEERFKIKLEEQKKKNVRKRKEMTKKKDRWYRKSVNREKNQSKVRKLLISVEFLRNRLSIDRS